jgi:hypothetical protein
VTVLVSLISCLAKTAGPQILLRLGNPVEEISAAPRRALEDVIEERR